MRVAMARSVIDSPVTDLQMSSAGHESAELGQVVAGRALLALCALTFLLGGGARGDISSLLLLRPVAAILLALGLALASRDLLRTVRVPALLLAAAIGYAALQLVPLPPGIWQALPGREIAAQSYAALGMQPGWLPATIAPFAGWNTLLSFLVPAAALVLAAAAGPNWRSAAVSVVVGATALTFLLSVLQLVSTGAAVLYFYQITNADQAVGLFANRNHNAMFLAVSLPLLALWTVQHRAFPKLPGALLVLLLAASLAIVALIAMMGSRGGLLLLGLTVPCAALTALLGAQHALGQRPGLRRRVKLSLVAALVLAIGVVGLVSLAGKGTAIDRLLGEDVTADTRYSAVPTIRKLIDSYAPIGAGPGAFVQAYKAAEPDSLVIDTYLNHVHNDYLEIAVEYGWVGIAWIAAVLGSLAFACFTLWRKWHRHANSDPDFVAALAAAGVLAALVAASAADYPLRTPSLALLAALCAAWLCWGCRREVV